MDSDDLSKQLDALGFKTATISKVSKHIKMTRFWQSNDEMRDWGQFYIEKRYDEIDIIISLLMTSKDNMVFHTEEISATNKRSEDLSSYRNQLGLNTQYIGRRGSYIVRFVSPEKGDVAKMMIKTNAKKLENLANLYFDKYLPREYKLLSDREIECLTWAARGKTVVETAIILGISKKTIEKHIHHSCHKLDATNKVQAVFNAARMNLISNISDPLTTDLESQHPPKIMIFQSRFSPLSDQAMN